MGDVHSIISVRAKINDQGMMCTFLGYTKNHTGDTHRMLNIHMRRIILIQDVICRNKTYGEYIPKKKGNQLYD